MVVPSSLLVGALLALSWDGPTTPPSLPAPAPVADPACPSCPAPPPAAPAGGADGCFPKRLFLAYWDEFTKTKDDSQETPEVPRRALPAPFTSPPFPTGEWQGFPLIGVHAATACYRCHPGAEVGRFVPTSVERVSCHASDLTRATNPNHAGLGWVDRCDRCHLPRAWEHAEIHQ